jgi:hypothetical protein
LDLLGSGASTLLVSGVSSLEDGTSIGSVTNAVGVSMSRTTGEAAAVNSRPCSGLGSVYVRSKPLRPSGRRRPGSVYCSCPGAAGSRETRSGDAELPTAAANFLHCRPATHSARRQVRPKRIAEKCITSKGSAYRAILASLLWQWQYGTAISVTMPGCKCAEVYADTAQYASLTMNRTKCILFISMMVRGRVGMRRGARPSLRAETVNGPQVHHSTPKQCMDHRSRVRCRTDRQGAH